MPYLAPFSHSTSVTDKRTNRWTTTVTTAPPSQLLKYGRLKSEKENTCIKNGKGTKNEKKRKKRRRGEGA